MEDHFENKPIQELAPPVLIPVEEISTDILDGIIENFILREGTDYGVSEVGYDQKHLQVLNKVKAKEYLITFDPETESVTLLTKKQWDQLMKGKTHVV